MDTQTIPPTPEGAGMTDRLELAKAIGIGILAAVLVFLAVVGWLTLQNTYAVVHGHNSELTQLKADEGTVVIIGTNLEQTQHVICQGLHLHCPPIPGRG